MLAYKHLWITIVVRQLLANHSQRNAICAKTRLFEPFGTTSLLQIMGCRSETINSESFRSVSRLGSWFSVSKSARFELTPLAESLLPEVCDFCKKTRVLCIIRNSLHRERELQTKATIPRGLQNGENSLRLSV
jgi:hypothetical protein